MEVINGAWYMKCCGREDPSRLRTVEAAAELIRKIGFLPLFSNDIPGFSVEERTCAADWWTDDPARDPWVWRQLLADRPDVVYGKFFDRRAGFVSSEFFPIFANYRRNGYDFDTRIDEGLAPHRERKLMQPFLTDGMPNDTTLYSFSLKARAGFGPGGERNYEGVLTDLQMQTYLIIRAFRQRQNKKGQPFGWHLAVLGTPEAKLGYEAFETAYKSAPEQAMEEIRVRVLRFFPGTEEAQMKKWLGIR